MGRLAASSPYLNASRARQLPTPRPRRSHLSSVRACVLARLYLFLSLSIWPIQVELSQLFSLRFPYFFFQASLF